MQCNRTEVRGRLATLVLMAAIAALASSTSASTAELSNERYHISVEEDGVLNIAADGCEARAFRPDFTVLFSEKDPKLAFRSANLEKVIYSVPTWQTGQGADADSLKKVDTSVNAGDGFEPSILRGATRGRSPDYFRSGSVFRISAAVVEVSGATVQWTFPSHSKFLLEASATLPSGSGEPEISVRLRPQSGGYFSVGYSGAPAVAAGAADDIWQPLLWQGKRFPKRSYLTLAFRCPAPSALVSYKGVTVGVAADESLMPFQPLPTRNNNQFGVLVRNAKGQAQPMVFAPVLGGPGSKMTAGEEFAYDSKLVVHPGSTVDAFEYVARSVCGFRDYRRNTDYSMNQTLANMIEYGLSEYSRFNEELRGCSYATDVPGAVKNVSALHPLSAALVTDSPEIYRRRALPIMEYMLSREKFLFAVSPDVKIQNPSWRLNGPCAPVSELAALYSMTGGQNPYLLDLAAEMLDKTRTLNLDVAQPGRTWDNLLALYRASGQPEYLEESASRANDYIAEEFPAKDDLASQSGFFWTMFVPKFQELLELYQETGDQHYLDASHEAARRFTQFVWMCPRIPEGTVDVNEDGLVPHYSYLRYKGHPQMKAPAEEVDAWRVSEIGLTCESTGTSTGHRAILLANHAPWMMRIGKLKEDPFLHDIARSAIVGRYANFPGYHINTGRTTVYEKPDYPLREHHELGYNSFHYNHIWPHVSLLIDYLVSEVEALSEGRITFPSQYTESYAYLKNKVYGDRPGVFYDIEDAWLWMPRGLLSIDNPQLNYVSARAGGTLLVAIANQSGEPQAAWLEINPDLARFSSSHRLRRWRNNNPLANEQFNGAAVELAVPPRGLECIAVEGVQMNPEFSAQDAVAVSETAGRTRIESDFAGGAYGMLISSGTGEKSAYVYLQETYEAIRSVTLQYHDNGEARSATDNAYPFEFTVPLKPRQSSFSYVVTVTPTEGPAESSERFVLGRADANGARSPSDE